MRKLHLVSSIALLGALALTAPAAADVPAIVPLQGYLLDSTGKAVDGDHRLTFFLYDAATDGDVLFTDNYNSVEVSDGYFVVYLGNQEDTPLDLGLFREHRDVWVEVVIDGSETVSPRTYLASVPYAGVAQYCGDAQTLGGRPSTDLVPAGALMPFAGTAAPAGWLLADGKVVKRADLPGAVCSHRHDVRRGRRLDDVQAAGSARPRCRRRGRAARGSRGAISAPRSVARPTRSPRPSSRRTRTRGRAARATRCSTGPSAHCGGTSTASNHVPGWSGCDYVDRTDAEYALSRSHAQLHDGHRRRPVRRRASDRAAVDGAHVHHQALSGRSLVQPSFREQLLLDPRVVDLDVEPRQHRVEAELQAVHEHHARRQRDEAAVVARRAWLLQVAACPRTSWSTYARVMRNGDANSGSKQRRR